MYHFPVDRNNIIRHSDCTQDRETTRKKILWDGKRKVKKHDIEIDFFVDNEHFKIWRDQLTPRENSRFGSI